MRQADLDAIARAILDANAYMTLATADPTGRPWASPVYFASAGHAEFFWVSSPDALHSRNLAARPQVSIVVFDSRTPLGEGQAVYMSAVAGEPADADLERGIEIFSDASVADGGREWKLQDVRPPGFHRLYRAAAGEHWILDPGDHPVHGRTGDHRTRVSP
jgi:Pyridoxamine 5'-phosphate oxidase